MINDLEDLQIATTRATTGIGWSWNITRAEAPETDIYGSVVDNANTFDDLTDYPVQPVAVLFTSLSEPLAILEGDYVTVTYDGGQMVNVYPPPLSGMVDTYYFIGLDGATYNDRWLCDPAEDLPTPTPTPSVTPTPSATPSPSVTPSPTPSVTPTAAPSSTPAPTPSATPSRTPSPAPTATPACRCYVVPQVGYASGGENLLILVDPYDFNPDTNETDIGTTTGTTGIETIAYHDPTGLLYTVNYDRLGTLDQVTGLFSPVSENPVGGGYGSQGYQLFYDIDGMSFHTFTGVLYSTVRKERRNDLLIQVDLATGKHIAGAFNGDDYVVLKEIVTAKYTLRDVDDIAFDPADGLMYAIENDSGAHDHLVIFNPADGSIISDIGHTYCPIAGKRIQDVEGLGFGCDGTLWGVTGNKTIIEQNDRLWEIDKTNAHLCNPRLLTHGTDYEAITCGYFTGPHPSPTPFLPAVDSGDYDGDGTPDIAIFRSDRGLWAIRALTRVYFGRTSDVPASADYDGDGTTDIGIFRGNRGLWAIRGLTRVYFGQGSDVPVPGDYNGDGTAAVGIFRGSRGLWAVRGLTRAYFGALSDAAVPGDYNGDGSRDFAVFRYYSGLWAIRSLSRLYFGGASDQLVPGDYDGNGAWEAGIFRAGRGLWAIRAVTRAYFGAVTDRPVPADFTGDLADDIAVFRATSGLWAVRNGFRVYYGTTGDIPVTR